MEKKVNHYFYMEKRLQLNPNNPKKLKKEHTVSNLSEVKTLVTRENLLIQKSIAKSSNISVATINKVIDQHLQLEKAKK